MNKAIDNQFRNSLVHPKDTKLTEIGEPSNLPLYTKCQIFITHIMSKFKLLLHCLQYPQIILCWQSSFIDLISIADYKFAMSTNHVNNCLQQRINKKCIRKVYQHISLERSAILDRIGHLRLFPFFAFSSLIIDGYKYSIFILAFQVR